MSAPKRPSFYLQCGKRAFDLVSAMTGVLFLFPLLAVVGLAVRLTSKGPAVFRQVRVGRYGKPFELLKFRSLRQGAEKGPQLTAEGDPRITPLGLWLRRTKMDELPQLWNVIRGDMSLVGPRPEVPRFVARYTKRQQEVFQERPGITGPEINIYEEELLAHQRDTEQFYLRTILPAKLKHDLAYVSHIQFSSDLGVLWQTFKKLLIRIYQSEKPAAHTLSASLEAQSPEQ